MDETHVVFQTIRLGDAGRVIPAGYYYSQLENLSGILLADVLPFHIIGGHITINFAPYEYRLVAVSLDGNKQSVPIRINFQQSIPYPNFNQDYSLCYIELKPMMHGLCSGVGAEGSYENDADLENITHLYLLRLGKDEFNKIKNNMSISMTLILSR